MTFCTCDIITDRSIVSCHETSGRSQLKASWPPLLLSNSAQPCGRMWPSIMKFAAVHM